MSNGDKTAHRIVTGKLRPLLPGDVGYDDRKVPWATVRNMLGLSRQREVSMTIHGYFILDKRQKPAVAIFKNCEIKEGNDFVRAASMFAPEPFGCLDEAMHYIRAMHLSSGDEPRVKVVALVPHPGLAEQRPNVMFVDRKEAKRM